MTGSHCLICGAVIVSGLYCYDCKWEMKRIRLESDMDLQDWMDEHSHSSRKLRAYDGTKSLEYFSSQ